MKAILFATAALGLSTAAAAEPTRLTDDQMQEVTAGIVYGIELPESLILLLQEFSLPVPDPIYIPHPCPPGHACIA